MNKDFFSIGVDKLTLCYTINQNSPLHTITEDTIELDFDDFKLRRIPSGHFKNSFHILSRWNNSDDDSLTWQVYATLKFCRYTDKEEKASLAWLYFENKTLYQQMYPRVNTVIFADYQSNILNMELRNITEIEIFIDSNKNIPKAVKYMLRNPNIDTIYNGKVVERKEKQRKLLYVHTGNLNKYTDLSLYIKQLDKDGFELKCYDKATEIREESHKEYILYWHKLKSNSKLYRIEINLKHAHLKDYLITNRIELTHNIVYDSNFLFDCFLHFANRLLRFRDDDKKISILETFA